MGLFDFFKKRKPDEQAEESIRLPYAPTMSGYTPTFIPFGDNVYASDIIVRATQCVANEMMKLNPRHIRTVNGKQQTDYKSSIAKCFRRPNQYMTLADLLGKMTVLRELTNNAFLYPDYIRLESGQKYYIGLYPLKPSEVDVLMDESERLYYRFYFGNGTTVTLPVSEVIHWRKDYGVDDFFGGNLFGAGQNRELLQDLQTFSEIKQSIAEAMKVSLTVNGVMQYVPLMSEDKLKAERDSFVADMRSGKSSVLFLDGKAEYKPITRDVKLVDKDTLDYFYQSILMTSGVSMPILTGDYTAEQKAAFYESALEAPIISLGQAMSKVFFSSRREAFGNEIILYPDEIQNMSIDKRIAFLQIAAPAGAVSKNEIRKTVGLPPIDGGDEYPRGYNNLDSETMGALGGTEQQTEETPQPDTQEQQEEGESENAESETA